MNSISPEPMEDAALPAVFCTCTAPRAAAPSVLASPAVCCYLDTVSKVKTHKSANLGEQTLRKICSY